MNAQLKGVGVSIVLHAVVLLALLGLSHSMARFSRPVLIDFSIENRAVKGDGGPKAAPAQKKRVVKSAARKRPKPVAPKPEPKEKLIAKVETPQKPIAATEPAASETATEEQAPVPAVAASGAGPSETGSPSAADGAAQAKGDGSSGTGGGSAEGLKQGYLRAHFAYIRDIVRQKLRYPKIARRLGWQGKVVVSFIVCLDGHAREITVREGSGHELLDRSAVAAVQAASPFPRPPVAAQLIIPITYRLN